MIKHAPGPWRAGLPGPKHGAQMILAENDFQTALVFGQANARLIAAAPELLEALIECLECEFAVTDRAAVDKARAAITKATGAA